MDQILKKFYTLLNNAHVLNTQTVVQESRDRAKKGLEKLLNF